MKITKKDIEKAKKLNGCEDEIEWTESILNEELTEENVIASHFIWAVGKKCFTGKLDTKLFDYCVRKDPACALAYTAKRLNDEQFDYCIRKNPACALAYTAKRLNDEQFDYCIRKNPWLALEYIAERLNDKQ